MTFDQPGSCADPRQEQRAMVALFFATLVLVGAHVASLYQPNTWINRDGRFYVNMNVTLVEDLSLEQSAFARSWYEGNLPWNHELPASFSNIALGRRGEHWPMHPWMMPVLSTPFFFAFGLIATLVFNVLLFGVIAAMGYRFARAYVSPSSAALAVTTLLFGTAIHEYAYDYHVDIFLLAIFSTALAALVTQNGYVLGACSGAILCLKPTSLILLPAVAALLSERGDRRTLVRALVGGAAVLGTVGLVNTYMFGAPWRFGYLRVLTVENGEKVLFSDENAFGTPLVEGMQRVWSGTWGLDRRMTMVALAAPGLLSMLARRPRYAVAALGTCIASFLVFSKYHFEGDRFLWPAIALLLPALGWSLDFLWSMIARVAPMMRRRPAARHALAAAFVAVAAMGAHLAVAPRVLEELQETPYGFGAVAVAEHGTFDLSGVIDDGALGLDRSGVSRVARGRFGHYLPRASPPAVITAALVTALLGVTGLVLLHMVLTAIAVWSAARLLEQIAGPCTAAVVPASLLLLPLARDAAIVGGPGLFAAAFGVLALHLARRCNWLSAGILGALAAWYGDAPWLFGLGVLLLAVMDSPAAMRRVALGGAAVLAVWGIGHLVLLGRPFASPDDFVLARVGGELRTFALDGGSPRAALRSLVEARESRYVVPLLAFAPFGLLAASRRDKPGALLIGAALLSLLSPGVLSERVGAAPSFALALLLALPLAPLASTVGEMAVSWVHRTTRRTHLLATLGALGTLIAIGTVHRLAEADETFHVASERGLRTASVFLDDRIPCDFLPWEHMSWECSHYDRGHFNQVGFALPEGIEVGGEPRNLLLLPLGASGQSRVVRWRHVRSDDTFTLRYAVPDRMRGGLRITIAVDGEVVDAFDVPSDAHGTIEDRVFDTAAWARRDVTLQITVSGRRVGETGVAVDGWFGSPSEG